ncbi:hypothetical protein [Microbacterium suwonense]|uniref:Transcriptional regulator, AbiEi antitoxin, Type IV TA system n=1 Tax=Microbacterium suwonense TaxID=683047 RepID=A0ABN6WY84_9MICO|nr:hypothetical protein [Microbacterium suwonense]BDZ37409.1 hypothetical protein GCM10025863_00230 [Microbacterium suwonense]BDZ40674.1 hypothetical protein GCM10025863_32880 [Microbacterium suwonense]
MPKSIDVTRARALILTRAQLRGRGHSERDIEHLVASEVLRRVRNDRYVAVDDWRGLWNEGRHLVEVVATHLNSAEPGPVFWGPSAAVLHALPLYRLAPKNVHTAILGARHGRTVAGVVWHRIPVDSADIVEIDGIRCTSLDRTILDLACASSAPVSLSAADAALRREAVVGQVQDADVAGEWQARMLDRAEHSHRPGIVQARRIIRFADGRAQLPGESVSRLHLRNLGFADPDLQVHVVGSAGDDYWLDFGFPRLRCFGEFDGKGKYLDDELRGTMSAEEVVLAEKRREDDIRGVTGWRMARWGSSDLRTAAVFGAKLAAFGIRPPG